ncbi:MAG UNVERIFIED_CONTAM: hypothetical protein LVR18_48395, partial [Planctomycetaceae bacterium]
MGFDIGGVDFNLMLNMRSPTSGVLPDLGAMKWFTFNAQVPEIAFSPLLDINVPDLGSVLPNLTLNLTFDVPTSVSTVPYIDYAATLPSTTLPAA